MTCPDCKFLEAQIDKLAKCILEHYQHEIGAGNPVHGEGACEVAVRLLERQALQPQGTCGLTDEEANRSVHKDIGNARKPRVVRSQPQDSKPFPKIQDTPEWQDSKRKPKEPKGG